MSHHDDTVKDEIIQYADGIVSTINPGVLPDGSNIDVAPTAKTDPHICNKAYNDVTDFKQDLIDLVATCQRHQQHTAYVHTMDSKYAVFITLKIYSWTQLLLLIKHPLS